MHDTTAEQADFFASVPNERRGGEYALPQFGDIATCKSCGAQIVWTRSANDRAVPLSLATVQTRNGVKYVLSHFADCKDAKAWSKKR